METLSGVARRRELGLASPRAAERAMLFPESAAQRLSLEAVLRGHNGCVNRMCWNESGSLLASGSDDRKVLLWSYPDTQRQPIALQTEHQANIFGVRFLPQTGDARLVTGAMDYTVQLHQLDTLPEVTQRPLRSPGGPRRQPNVAVTAGSSRTVVYSCHRSRVKDVATEPLNPHMFWSAAEDGGVRQFDTRVPTSQQRDYESRNLLLTVKHKGRLAELKSLNLNPAKPHQLAVAASDPHLRVYDRRMLAAGPPERGRPQAAPMLALAPPHLALCVAGGSGGACSSRMHATYASFSNRGDKVVATYHGDHAYCFDVTGAAPPPQAAPGTTAAAASGSAAPALDLFAQPVAAAALAAGRHLRNGSSGAAGGPSSGYTAGGSSGGGGGGGGMGDLPGMLPAAAERAKADGNLHLFSKQFYEAVQRYNEAIRLAPWAPVLYTNRALALLQRNWEGDAFCALHDAETAVCLDPFNAKAHYRRTQALRAAGMLKSAATATRLFKQQFPDNAADVEGLEEQIASEMSRQVQQAELRRQQAEQRRQQRRRRGLQFDREQRDRQRERHVPAAPAAADPEAAAGAEAAAEGAAAVGVARQAGGASGAAAAEPAGPSGGGEGGEGGGAAAGPAAAGAARAAGRESAAAGGDRWEDLFNSGSSEEEGDDADTTAAASAVAAAASGVDAQYAAALEAAAAAGAGCPGGAAAAPGAPTIDDGLAAAGGRPGAGQGRQPSLWNAFEGGRRMLQRYIGQCNLQTDIKEACFLGADGSMVAAGSDDGRVFIFSAATGECVRVIMADEDVANAVQPHPHLPVLATSGIESTIKLWSPEGDPTPGGNIADVIRRNQERMKDGPAVLHSVDSRLIAALTDNPELLRALMHRATRRAREPGDGGEGEDAAAEAGEEEEGSDSDGARDREISCRVA